MRVENNGSQIKTDNVEMKGKGEEWNKNKTELELLEELKTIGSSYARWHRNEDIFCILHF